MRNVLVIGGAGFIGSHLVSRLLDDPTIEQVTIYDNLSSGTRKHIENSLVDRRCFFVHADIMELGFLNLAMTRVDTVFHLAANPDIARAVKEPDIDFRQGTMLLNAVLEAMRTNGVKNLYYMSGSGVYGDCGETVLTEEMPLKPISTYGASKAGCECLISSYCHMFGFNAACFRFANVVGPRQTHGVGYDFIHKLWADPTKLEILGDGTQSKSYIHVSDVINAIFTVPLKGFDVYNVATQDCATVSEIASLAVVVMGLFPGAIPDMIYSGGGRGWKGDVPVVRFSSAKIRTLGWRPQHNSYEAIRLSLEAMKDEMECAT
jgi:UDP-glucose 4-epimerase